MEIICVAEKADSPVRKFHRPKNNASKHQKGGSSIVNSYQLETLNSPALSEVEGKL